MLNKRRRYWRRITHKHEWEVIVRGTLGYFDRHSGERKGLASWPCWIERCWCGAERAWEVENPNRPKAYVNPEWLRHTLGCPRVEQEKAEL